MARSPSKGLELLGVSVGNSDSRLVGGCRLVGAEISCGGGGE
jgi:hypothetical protein